MCASGLTSLLPFRFSPLSAKMTSQPGDFYKCPYGGPRGTFDIPPTSDQLESASSYRVHLAEEVEDLLKKATMSRVPSRPFKALAGTVTCPECDGNVRVTSGLLNLANVRLGPRFHRKILPLSFSFSDFAGCRFSAGSNDRVPTHLKRCRRDSKTCFHSR